MKRIDLFFTAVLVPFDFLTLLGAAAAAYALRLSPWFAKIRPVTFSLPFNDYLNVVVPIVLVWLLIFALSGLYSTRPHRIAVEITRVILASSTGIAVILAVTFFSRELFESRFIMLAAWVFAIVFVVIERLLIRSVQRSLRTYGVGMKQVVMIGKTKSGNDLHRFFDKTPRLGYAVTGHFASFTPETKGKIIELKNKNLVDVIVMANPDAEQKEVKAIKTFTDIEHLTFIYSAGVFPSSAVRPIIHTFAGQPIIEVPKTPLDGWGAIYKRIFDIFVSSLFILITLPLQLFLALAIIIENPGPVLFRQKRVGQRGKPFKYFKFRSMVKDASRYRFDPEFVKKYGNLREGTPLFKLKHDPRITRVGKLIRKFHIDEIPEFYLVLFGRMSLVGPRPHLTQEVEQYKPSQRKVLNIKPGITGISQISGQAELEFDEEVRLDMYYIENWSPWLDLVILLKTPFVVLFERGTY
ncbi:sugar transferase [Patescibacteria group bacterium]|nr:sugar transferase [Patescibacteria group bacterium]